ncbi:beta-glucosidase [Sphingobacterium alimentarium]|uniref:Beta-glucosidase n=1 Tax=Sphingobacterium alimentarium TaxID=797292 RepID=A0A4R3VYA0_9SPHI|nr:glycoside hydrolase family 3 N-terminal domain-containing protein [Sphingobacterium alimentarium]TCV15157.1 beta-glucosidase [Sphingobacterium alimentarium]
MRKTFLIASTLFIFNCSFAQKPKYKDPSQPVEVRVKDLLSRMTPEEKFWQCFMIPGDLDNIQEGQYKHGIFGLQVSAGTKGGGAAGQLLQYNANEDAEKLTRKINSIQKFFIEETRLGIPIIPFDEALHGLMREGATSFPQAIALASTFNLQTMHEVANAIATETKLRGIRHILTPVINVANDVRWGRTEETYGEDTYLTSQMGIAFMSEFEKQNIVTTPKHFLANVGEGGRDSYPIHWSKRYLEETHLYPFKKAFSVAKSRSVMTAYNFLDGRPATANHWLLTEKLKNEWKFNGFIISDASAVGGPTVLHRTAKDYPDAAAQAMNAGLDVIFQTEYDHYKLFSPPFYDGRISQERIDDAVSRVLRAKFELGLFEKPYINEQEIKQLVNLNHKHLAEKSAAESFVLLQNKNNTLPINSKTYKNIVIIGSDAEEERLGGYSGPGNKKVSIIDGLNNLKKRYPDVNITYVKGVSWHHKHFDIIPSSYLNNNSNQGLKVEYFDNVNLIGQPVETQVTPHINNSWTLGSPDDSKLHFDNYSIRWTGEIKAPKTGTIDIGLQGNDGFRLFINNELIIDKWEKLSYSTITKPYQIEKDKSYQIKVEFRETRGNAQIKLIWNYGITDYAVEFQKAITAAKTADYIVFVGGIHEGEFQDRALLGLGTEQENMINELSSLNKPLSVILVGGSAITMTNWKDKVDGILNVWYPGEEGGNAIAKTLFGEYNPSGKLPITYPIHEGQLPLTYNHHPTGRGDDYHNLSGEPLYPFGYGLSYTQFEISDLQLSKKNLKSTDTLNVKVKVKNIGTRDGGEVVQLYIKDMLSTVGRPIIELKGFEKVYLKSGEEKVISLNLSMEDLAFLNEDMNWNVEKGEYRIMIGNSSKNLPLKESIYVQ